MQAKDNAQDAAIAELKAAVQALQAEQARAQARITELEAALARQGGVLSGGIPPAVTTSASAPESALPAKTQSRPAMANVSAATPLSRLMLSGDMRIRYESNFGIKGVRDRNRGVLRARLRAAYALNDWLTIGGQLATGDPDDPNSTDITLSRFDDGLQVSLDQAYLRLAPGNFQAYLGKIPQSFVRTELVWDGDVSPQGASASYTTFLGGMKLRTNALYFIVDEAVAGPDSRMIGGQTAVETPPAPMQTELAVGY